MPKRVSPPGSAFTQSRRPKCTIPKAISATSRCPQLELSPDNVRKTPADASAFTELKASIAAHGLLENLIACSMGPGADGIARYAVIAGGRRLAAMQALAAQGALDEDHPVPCRMIGAIVAAEEVSLAENSVRAAMHPADQVEAFPPPGPMRAARRPPSRRASGSRNAPWRSGCGSATPHRCCLRPTGQAKSIWTH